MFYCERGVPHLYAASLDLLHEWIYIMKAVFLPNNALSKKPGKIEQSRVYIPGGRGVAGIMHFAQTVVSFFSTSRYF